MSSQKRDRDESDKDLPQAKRPVVADEQEVSKVPVEIAVCFLPWNELDEAHAAEGDDDSEPEEDDKVPISRNLAKNCNHAHVLRVKGSVPRPISLELPPPTLLSVTGALIPTDAFLKDIIELVAMELGQTEKEMMRINSWLQFRTHVGDTHVLRMDDGTLAIALQCSEAPFPTRDMTASAASVRLDAVPEDAGVAYATAVHLAAAAMGVEAAMFCCDNDDNLYMLGGLCARNLEVMDSGEYPDFDGYYLVYLHVAKQVKQMIGTCPCENIKLVLKESSRYLTGRCAHLVEE